MKFTRETFDVVGPIQGGVGTRAEVTGWTLPAGWGVHKASISDRWCVTHLASGFAVAGGGTYPIEGGRGALSEAKRIAVALALALGDIPGQFAKRPDPQHEAAMLYTIAAIMKPDEPAAFRRMLLSNVLLWAIHVADGAVPEDCSTLSTMLPDVRRLSAPKAPIDINRQPPDRVRHWSSLAGILCVRGLIRRQRGELIAVNPVNPMLAEQRMHDAIQVWETRES